MRPGLACFRVTRRQISLTIPTVPSPDPYTRAGSVPAFPANPEARKPAGMRLVPWLAGQARMVQYRVYGLHENAEND